MWRFVLPLVAILFGCLEAFAGVVENVADCAPLLTTDHVALGWVAKDSDMEETQVEPLAYSWLRIGSVADGVYVDLLTFTATDYTGFLDHNPLQQTSTTIHGVKYGVLKRSPLGRFAILSPNENELMAPLILTENANPKSQIPLVAGESFFRFSRSGNIQFSPDEQRLAFNSYKSKHIYVVDTQTGMPSDGFDMNTLVDWIDWSHPEPNTLLLLASGRDHLELVRRSLGTQNPQSLLELPGDFYGATTRATYLPGQKKIVVSVAQGPSSRLYLLDEITGNGQIVNLPEHINNLAVSPNGRYFAAFGDEKIYIYQTESLAVWGSIDSDQFKGKKVLLSTFNGLSQLAVVLGDGSVSLFDIALK